MENTDALSEFGLPIIIQNDKDYQDTLRKKLNAYQEVVKVLDVSNDCKNQVTKVCEAIGCALDSYYNGYTIDATQMLIEEVKKHEQNPFLVSTLTNNYAFRGLAPKELRLSDHPKYDEMMKQELYFFKARVSETPLEKNDMFHIPYDKRAIITTQRFSMPGLPCMYFATTSFGCWLELSMPEKEYFYCSAYKLPPKWKILNLCIHHSILQGALNGSLGAAFTPAESLVVFPFVIATSFRVLERNRTFRSEYIISQLLMQVAKIIGLDGIAYFSKRLTDFGAYPQCINLAIICDQSTDKGSDKYSDKCREIQLTQPQSYKEFALQSSDNEAQGKTLVIKQYKNNPGHENISIMGNTMKYHQSKFALFDEYLVSQSFGEK